MIDIKNLNIGIEESEELELEAAKRKKKDNEPVQNLLKVVHEQVVMSEFLRCKINKEQDPAVVFDDALRCISLMTGDTVFYETNKNKLRNGRV